MHLAYYICVLKHCREYVREIQHEGECREVNTARGVAECCIYLETPPSAVFFVHDELRQCFNCYIVFLAGFSRL